MKFTKASVRSMTTDFTYNIVRSLTVSMND